jgi:NADH ubiquinone oxidoreductase, 20 Kd subunit
MAPVIRRLYDQMLDPKWAISMGACCSSTGVFNNYALVPADKFMPIDVHVPGCPPRPEALMHGILLLRDRIHGHKRGGLRERYGALGTEELPPLSNRQQTHQPDRPSPARGGGLEKISPKRGRVRGCRRTRRTRPVITPGSALPLSRPKTGWCFSTYWRSSTNIQICRQLYIKSIIER